MQTLEVPAYPDRPIPDRVAVGVTVATGEEAALSPKGYGDTSTIAEKFRDGITVTIDLTKVELAEAQRILDFVSGLSLALHGRLEKAGTKTFLLSPAASGQLQQPEQREYAEQVAIDVRDRLLHLSESQLAGVVNMAPDPSELAGRIVSSLPTANVWDQHIGPFFDTTSLRALKGISRQALDRQAKLRTILSVQTSDGTRLYPAFQFDAEGNPLEGLRPVLSAMDPENRDPWGDALWLVTPAAQLGGSSPSQLLRRGEPLRVVELADRIGRTWQP